MTKHSSKFNSQFNEVRISGSNADASKYYSGVRVFGIVKKTIAKTTVSKPTANTKVKNG